MSCYETGHCGQETSGNLNHRKICKYSGTSTRERIYMQVFRVTRQNSSKFISLDTRKISIQAGALVADSPTLQSVSVAFGKHHLSTFFFSPLSSLMSIVLSLCLGYCTHLGYRTCLHSPPSSSSANTSIHRSHHSPYVLFMFIINMFMFFFIINITFYI